jgi:hypothetical protein
MKFASTRLIAADIKALVSFYEKVTAQKAEWLAPVFAEIVTPAATLAFGGAETVALFKREAPSPPPIAPLSSSSRLMTWKPSSRG